MGSPNRSLTTNLGEICKQVEHVSFSVPIPRSSPDDGLDANWRLAPKRAQTRFSRLIYLFTFCRFLDFPETGFAPSRHEVYRGGCLLGKEGRNFDGLDCLYEEETRKERRRNEDESTEKSTCKRKVTALHILLISQPLFRHL